MRITFFCERTEYKSTVRRFVAGNAGTVAVFVFQLTGLSGGLFPASTSALNLTDYLDALSKIVAVSSCQHNCWP